MGMDATGWDERYAASDRVWSAGPNEFVEEACAGLEPGRAIDLAAGEGRNALWLAARGWDATAVDYSAVAIDRARTTADERGVPLRSEVADLETYVPQEGSYELVVIAYLHLPAPDSKAILARAAAAVAPGGRLVVVGHDRTNLEHGIGGPQDPAVLTSPADIVSEISPSLLVQRAEVVDREVSTDDGPRFAKDTLVVSIRPGT